MKNLLFKHRRKCNRGFSFVEVMLSLALFLILASAGLGTYFRYYTYSLTNQDFNSVRSMLQQTRFKAMKNPDNSNYGLYLSTGTDELITFRNTYVPNDPGNVTFQLERLSITNLSLQPSPGITNQILFETMTGKTQNDGTFTVSNSNFSYDFTVNIQGAFE